jgi:DNA-binding CsgD family transcriptional regulator
VPDLLGSDTGLVLAAIEDGRRDTAAEPMPWALLDGLQRLIPCDMDVAFQRHTPSMRSSLIQAVKEDGSRTIDRSLNSPESDPFWDLWPTSMCSWPQRTGNLREVIHTGDFLPTERECHVDPMYRYLAELNGLRYCMIVSLPAPPGEARRVTFMRSEGPAFTERDRQVAALARPHLNELFLDAERRRRGPLPLSPREWEVLELAAAGEAYGDIAAQLFVSVGTVRKHMEHVRERLGVHSVRAAAALALPRPAGHEIPRPRRPQ